MSNITNRFLTERVADLRSLGTVKTAGALRYIPQQLAHVYIKLDFKLEFENARTAENAKGFHRSVARAAMAANDIALSYEGLLLEVQGSMLHVGLPRRSMSSEMDSANSFVADFHWALRALFPDKQKRVQGWRMTVDAGKTLVVAGRGVHGDNSYVSLGKSANKPAKHMYAQLDLPEADRQLKCYYVGIRDPMSGTAGTRDKWQHFDLDKSKTRLAALGKIASDAREAEPKLDYLEAAPGWKLVTARAAPLAPAGSPASPSVDHPYTYYGWVMRADLDGFTARVEKCFDNDQELQKLAAQFYCIMDAAAKFAEYHKEMLVQLPWAGDNFTAAAVFELKLKYDEAIPKRLIELSLDFNKDMAEEATQCGFGGWAYGVAGGDAQGNAGGNIYLAGVEVGGRRYLVGTGEGVGRSVQAFADINPKAGEIVVYKPDWERLDASYKKLFEPAVTTQGKQSTLFVRAKADALAAVRAEQIANATPTVITFPTGPREISTKPHFR